MIKKVFGLKDKKSFENITLENIENKMHENGFNQELTQEIISILEKRFNEYGENEFKEWFAGLHYRVPDELHDESLSIKIYDKHSTDRKSVV